MILDIQFNVDQIIKQYGPTVWSAAQQQVKVDIIDAFLWVGIWAMAAIVAFLVMRRGANWLSAQIKGGGVDSYDEGMLAVIRSLAWVGAVVSAFVFALLALQQFDIAFQALLNPTWAAIQHVKP